MSHSKSKAESGEAGRAVLVDPGPVLLPVHAAHGPNSKSWAPAGRTLGEVTLLDFFRVPCCPMALAVR